MTPAGQTAAMSSYDPILVTLSVIIAIGAGYTALDMAGRIVESQGLSRRLWLLGGAFAMGLGIWSMHFTGMLAMQMDHVLMTYDVTLTVASMLVAIVASWWALYVASRPRIGTRHLIAGGFLMGMGIATMHYTGMAAMRMPTVQGYDPWLFVASMLIAVTGSIAALFLTFRLRTQGTLAWSALRLGSATLVGIAISGMHYVGMAGARYAMVPTVSQAPLIQIDNLGGAAIAAGTLIILMIAIVSSYKQRMEAVLASQRSLNSLILDAAGDGIFGLDADDRITFVNPEAVRLTGFSESELLGQSMHPLCHSKRQDGSPYPVDACPIQAVLRDGNPRHVANEVFWRKDGKSFPVDYQASPIWERETIRGAVVTFRDITERKQAESAIAQRSAELETANEALRTADRYKDEFLSVISHELRTPLNFILALSTCQAPDHASAMSCAPRSTSSPASPASSATRWPDR